jgi:hypothetical protein
MFSRLYIEALLIDADLADQVWELWDAGVISDDLAAWAWCILVIRSGHLPVSEPAL